MRFEMIKRNQSRSQRKCWTAKELTAAIHSLGLEVLPYKDSSLIIAIEFPSERRKEVEERLRRVSPVIAYKVIP